MTTPYEMIKTQLGQTVPFASYIGVEVTSVGDGVGEARLPQTETSINHLGTQHAGALYTLGEAASGAAMAGAFVSQIMSIRPVAANAQIQYKKIAKGEIVAKATTSSSGADLLSELSENGKTAFDVDVSLTNVDGDEVASMTVNWHVSRSR